MIRWKSFFLFFWLTLSVYCLMGFFYGELSFLFEDGRGVVLEKYWIPAALICFCLAIVFKKTKCGLSLGNFCGINLSQVVFCCGLIGLILSDYPTRHYTYCIGQSFRFDLLYLGLVGVGLGILIYRTNKQQLFFGPWFLLLVQLALFAIFLRYADSRLIFSDDHPSFLYRLQLLKEQFPRIPFYNTDWNTGYSAREFFATGAINVFLLCWPILIWVKDLNVFENAQIYTVLVGYLFLLLIPWSIYWACKLLGLKKEVASLAAVLALGPSMGFFEWLLKYGTMGFAVSIALVPLTFVLAIKLAADDQKPGWLSVAIFVVVSSLCLMWTLSVLAFVPLVFWAVINLWHYRSTERMVKVLAFICFFILLNGSWLVVFVSESKVVSFLSATTLPGSHSKSVHQAREEQVALDLEKNSSQNKALFATLIESQKRFRESFAKINPLIVFLFIPGLALLDRNHKRYWASTVFWLLLIGYFGDSFKPQLELRRMIVLSSFLMVIPSALALERILTELVRWISQQKISDGKILQYSLAYCLLTILFGSILISPVMVNAAYVNHSDEKYTFASEIVPNLSLAISKFGGTGRTLFLGFVLQELSSTNISFQDGGHIAPLASFSGKELYASDFYHRKWSSVDPIPLNYRQRGTEGIEQFLDLINVSAVVTLRHEWSEYCLSNPNYQQVFQGDRFRLFTRKSDPSGYLLRGKAEVTRERNAIFVIPQTEELVIKYRYFPQLKYPTDAELFPVPVFVEDLGGGKEEQVNYIGLKVKPSLLGHTIKLGF